MAENSSKDSCYQKNLQQTVFIKKFFGLLAAFIFLLAGFHIFHLAKLFLKTQNLPSSISLLMSLITNFYLIKHLEFIHGLWKRTMFSLQMFYISQTKIPERNKSFILPFQLFSSFFFNQTLYKFFSFQFGLPPKVQKS